jgi:hypothetical protein
MTVNGTITSTVWTDPTIVAGTTNIRAVHLNELRTAINNLAALTGNVVNCNCANVETCQIAATCQTCQIAATCQTCESAGVCQTCEAATPCQTCQEGCQACQTCQTCQICQTFSY